VEDVWPHFRILRIGAEGEERRPEADCPAIDPFVLERGQGKIVGGGDIPGPSQTGESTLGSQAFGFRDEALAALLETRHHTVALESGASTVISASFTG
jgi:hypothetical protein